MFEAKLTSKGQITIPIKVRHMLNVKTGERVSFQIKEQGIIIDKSNRPLTIQERFADYDITPSNKELEENMKEFDMGADVGEEHM
jgi:AbrB family looped-hinge helix DNA binding protein